MLSLGSMYLLLYWKSK